MSNSYNSLNILWPPPEGLGHSTGSALSSTQSLYSPFQLALLHCCCYSWWSSHCMNISRNAVSLTAIGMHFYLLGSFCKDSSHATQCHASIALQDVFTPPKLLQPGDTLATYSCSMRYNFGLF